MNNLKQPLVTVAMVTYNSEKYIGVAIQSVLSSTYTNFELIISDDASTDNTWEIIKSYKDERIRAYRNETNIREYPNRNKCIDLAKGKYFIFIDGDDYLYPHGLEFIVKMLEKFPSCAMALMHNQRKNVIYPAIVTPHMYYIGEFFFSGFNNIAFTNTLFKTHVLKEVGGLPIDYGAGDTFIRNKIALKYNSLIITNNHTWWRETPNQASQLLFLSKSYFVESYKMKLFFLKNKNPLSESEVTDAFVNLYRIIGREILKKLMRFKFKQVILLSKELEFSFSKFKYVNSRFIKKDPFKSFSAETPYLLSLDQD